MKLSEIKHWHINILITFFYFTITIRFRLFSNYLFFYSLLRLPIGIYKNPKNIIIIFFSYLLGYFLILDNNPFILAITIYFPCRRLIRCLLYYNIIRYVTLSDEEKKEFNYFFKLFTYFKNHGYQLFFCFFLICLLRIFTVLFDDILFIYFYPKSHFIDKEEKYFICANLFNNENILPQWIRELKKLIFYLGINNVYISIFENGDSKDKTAFYLNNFHEYLEEKKIPNKIVTTHIIEKKGKKRIEFLSEIRNKALEYLYEIPNINFNKTRIIFLNDIIYNYQDVIKLISTNKRDYDVVCPLDFIHCFYDVWVSIDLSGNHFKNEYPYFYDKISSDAIVNDEIIRVFSCWNGMVSMKALPFKNKMIYFRNSSKEDTSECTLMNSDLYLNGFQKVLLNPNIKVAYEYYYYFLCKIWIQTRKNFYDYFQWYFSYNNYSNLYVTEDLKSKFLPLHPKLKRYYNTHFLKNGTNLKDYLI